MAEATNGMTTTLAPQSLKQAAWRPGTHELYYRDDKKALSDFEDQLGHNVAYDAAGNLAYLATSSVNLRLTQERWPKLQFHATREHSAKL